MSHTTAPGRRSLIRVGTVGLVVAASGLLGAPTATAAEDERPVIALDPPDLEMFLIAPEMEDGSFALGEAATAAGMDGGAAAAALARAAEALPPEALPPEAAAALGARAGGIGAAAAATEDVGLDVPHGGTIHLQFPSEVDPTDAVFVLDVYTADWDDLPRRYRTDPLPSDQPLTVADLGGGAFDIAVPAAVPPYGPAAELTVKGLVQAGTGEELPEDLMYFLELTAAAPATVNLSPSIGYAGHATCSIYEEELCPGPSVRAGQPLDLVVPPDSALVDLGFAQLDTADYALLSLSDEEPFQFYDSETNPELVTAHGPAAATLTVPADARPARFLGWVQQGDPATGISITVFEFEVPAAEFNPGLRSDTGWVEEVREVSPGSTAAVAGGALLLVSGLVGVAAVRPGRRPPLGG